MTWPEVVAAAVSLVARDRGGPAIAFQLPSSQRR